MDAHFAARTHIIIYKENASWEMVPNSRSPYYMLAAMGRMLQMCRAKSRHLNAMSLLFALQTWLGQTLLVAR